MTAGRRVPESQPAEDSLAMQKQAICTSGERKTGTAPAQLV